MGSLGDLGLKAIRDSALRASRLAKALFDAPESDVIAVNDGRVWRAKERGPYANDDSALRFAALAAKGPFWIADARAERTWRTHPAVQAEGGVRFCAGAPIALSDGRGVGVLYVSDVEPRPHDPELAARLADLAACVADECDRFLGGETRMIRDLFDRAPGLMAVTRGPDHVFELANPAFCRFIGDRKVVGLPIRQAMPLAEPQGVLTILDEVYATGRLHGGNGRRVLVRRNADGALTEVYADFVFQPLRDASGEISGVFFQGHDVTAAKLAAIELAESQRELQAAVTAMQTVFDQSLDVICMIDDEGRVASMSPQSEDLWGYRPDEMIGRPSIEFVHPEDHERTWAVAVDVHEGRPTKSFENRYLHKDGGVIPMMWSAVWSQAHAMTFCIGRDMREHEASEAKLRHAQKLEAVGRLTGGVAHDFNNLLTVVIGSSELLTEALADNPDLQPVAQLILDTADKGAALVSRLLAFSRQQSLVSETMDSGRLLKSILPILERTFSADIQIVVEADDDVRWRADPTQVAASMLNLCLNARDAMQGGGGRLTLSVGRAPGEERLVALSVSDTGHGMTPETLQRVMEPFFTTKPVGKGSGLGLSMVYGFAQQSGGRLTVESEPGRGTRVTLCLPESDEELAAPAAAARIPAGPRGRRILLVEDDGVLRAQLSRQLIDLGHQVNAFATGPTALEWLTKSGGVDLLMTDIVMPGGMNGRQLANYARALAPETPILFTSGHSDEAQLQAARLLPRAGFLPKPYRRRDLAQALEEAFAQ